MLVEFGVGIVFGPFDDDRERRTPHTSGDFDNVVSAVGSQLGGRSDEFVPMQNEVGCFAVGLLGVVVRSDDASQRIRFGNRQRRPFKDARFARIFDEPVLAF